MEVRIVSSVQVRSEGGNNKRLCDLGFDDKGHVYLIDVENDRNGKRKYVACLDKYFLELSHIMKKKIVI